MTTRNSKPPFKSIPFNNLLPLYQLSEKEIGLAILRVLKSGYYILGPEVEAFEKELATYLGVNHVIGVASGTDAITLALQAVGCGVGKTVVTVANSAPATVLAIRRTGALVEFLDIDPSDAMVSFTHEDLQKINAADYFVPVHLYGQLLDLRKIAECENTITIEDACQAIRRPMKREPYQIASMSHAACLSFYPTKNLGAFGDGGAIATNSPEVMEAAKKIRNYGLMNSSLLIEYGLNSRLDEIQAAILRVKLKSLDTVNRMKKRIHDQYRNVLKRINNITLLECPFTNGHLFPIFVKDRLKLAEYLKKKGIGTKIHYEIPAHRQTCEPGHDYLRTTESYCARELSLPNWFGMTIEMVDYVCNAIEDYYA